MELDDSYSRGVADIQARKLSSQHLLMVISTVVIRIRLQQLTNPSTG